MVVPRGYKTKRTEILQNNGSKTMVKKHGQNKVIWVKTFNPLNLVVGIRLIRILVKGPRNKVQGNNLKKTFRDFYDNLSKSIHFQTIISMYYLEVF